MEWGVPAAIREQSVCLPGVEKQGRWGQEMPDKLTPLSTPSSQS